MKLGSKCFIAVAAALVAQTAGAAVGTQKSQPNVVLYGGGATFPINAYVGDTWLDYSPQHRLSNTLPLPVGESVNPFLAGSTSLFRKFSLSTVDSTNFPDQKFGTVGVSYCQGGSGVGRGVLVNTLNATANCGDYSTGTPLGVSGSARKADFGGSDAPLGSGDVTNFNNTAGSPAQQYSALYNQLVQLPAVAGSIAMVYNNPDLTSGETTYTLNLTRSDICGIFSGSITNWNQLTHTAGITLPSKPIKVVVRSDSSGTTFSMTNFLSAACPTVGAQPGGVAVTGFKTVNTFKTGLPGGAASFPGVYSSGSVEVSGNGGIVTAVAATDGAIGYADVADTVSRNKRAGGGNLKFAKVSYAADIPRGARKTIAPGGADVTCPGGQVIAASPTSPVNYSCPAVVYNKLGPAANLLQKNKTGVTLKVSFDKVVGSNDSNGRPVITDISYANWGGATPAANCVALVLPNDYAQPPTAATAKAPADFSTYPIIAVSYLLATAEGNGPSKTAALRGLMRASYNPDILAVTKTIGGVSGFAPLVLRNADGSAFALNSFLSNCIRN